MCSEHTAQEINGLLMETEVDSTHEDIETAREAIDEATDEPPEQSKSSSLLETSSESLMNVKPPNECNKSPTDL